MNPMMLVSDVKCHIVSWPYLVCAYCRSNRTTAMSISFYKFISKAYV